MSQNCLVWGKNPHISSQKCCECGRSETVEEKHERRTGLSSSAYKFRGGDSYSVPSSKSNKLKQKYFALVCPSSLSSSSQ